MTGEVVIGRGTFQAFAEVWPTLAVPPAGLALWRHARPLERLALFLPVLVLPSVGTAADLATLAALYLLVGLVDAGAGHAARAGHGDHLGLALLVPPLLVLGLASGGGAALALGLLAAARHLEDKGQGWRRLVLAGIAGALALDLALVSLAIERGFCWLALGAAIGTARAAWRALGDPPPADAVPPAMTGPISPALALEALLAMALLMILAFYGALLAHEPALRGLAVAGGYLTVPPLALALSRMALLGLDRPRPKGVDPLAVAFLAAWALAATLLLEA